MQKPQTMAEFREVSKRLIQSMLDAVTGEAMPDDFAQIVADEIIYVGCPYIFMIDANELPFADDVLAAGNCLSLEE